MGRKRPTIQRVSRFDAKWDGKLQRTVGATYDHSNRVESVATSVNSVGPARWNHDANPSRPIVPRTPSAPVQVPDTVPAKTRTYPQFLFKTLWTTSANKHQVLDGTLQSRAVSATVSRRQHRWETALTVLHPSAAATPATRAARSTHKLHSSYRSHTTQASCCRSDPARVQP